MIPCTPDSDVSATMLPVAHNQPTMWTLFTNRDRWALVELFPSAPRRWSDLGSPIDDIAGRRDWGIDAAMVLGFKVMLDCGDNNEVWVVRASPVPQNDQEPTP
jgi:hypothetical protein